MLSRLLIRNYILIDSLEVSFPEGLIIITGQTGAGKSILLGALSLLTGAKADASVISSQADNCVVEAEFTGAGDRILKLLEEADVDCNDGNLLIRRVIANSGRSRSFINDCPVPVTLLQELSSLIVDIHSQHKSLLLTDKSFQLSVLDSFASDDYLLKECSEAWDRLRSSEAELKSLKEKCSRLKSDEDYNRSRWERLNSAVIRDGELAELEDEHKRLANAEQIKGLLLAARSALDSDESSGNVGTVENLRDARRQLEHVSAFMPEASELASRVESARIEISDILDELISLDSGISVSEDRLGQVEERMSLIYNLFSRFSCNSEAELIRMRDELSDMLFDYSEIEERISELEKSVISARNEYDRICGALHSARVEAAPRFAESITESLHFLELEKARFQLLLEPGMPSSSGTDRVQFLFSSNGTELQDVAKCASGGEISRIMLSLKAMMAKFVGMPTLIFDEIDTGVSGSVADKMGQMICSMGKDMQVFSITHLPQVAAKGDAHYVVSKTEDSSGRVISGMVEVSGHERTMEIARLLSGATITDAAVANAESLLQGC